MKKNIGMFLLGAAIAVGLIVSAAIAYRAALRVSHSESIRVKGSASQRVRSDFGIWRGSISVAAPSLEEAAEKLEAAEKSATDLITAAGFRMGEAATWESISITTVFKKNENGVDTPEILRYQLLRSLEISSPDVERLDKINRGFTDLVRQGINVSNYGASYVITNLDDYKLKLLAAATENGRQRAEILARSAAGGQVGGLISASQGIFQILAPGSSDISDFGTYDKSTIDKEVKAVVTLEFGVE